MGGTRAGRAPKRRALVASLAAAAASIAAPALVHDAAAQSSVRSPRSAVGESLLAARAADAEGSGQAALALITVPWQELLPGWRIEFRPAREGYLGLTFRTERRIEIYVRTNRPLASTAHDIAHELGHAFDVSYNDALDRATYLRLRGLSPTTPWWTCDGCTDLEVAAGDYAETFAAWAAPRYRFYSRLAKAPSDEQLNEIAAALFPLPLRQSS